MTLFPLLILSRIEARLVVPATSNSLQRRSAILLTVEVIKSFLVTRGFSRNFLYFSIRRSFLSCVVRVDRFMSPLSWSEMISKIASSTSERIPCLRPSFMTGLW